ncbi:hypothetical protein [Hymenobacter metallilatus]|uniref:Uncharacterized protein n=1 Tax=Hymenobacter metallilatus TaxID=2493666 RepID=A0A428JCX6_9BACT|nr:hypothetical protein [Hymenobacter metallilatus]RSK29839.1 hypothetical protein EI290_16010 [Hymenobacter metallilatus]
MPLLSLLAGVIGSLATFSYKYGALEGKVAANADKIETLRTDLNALRTDYQADKAKREAEAAARLASYEQARAAKLAEMEAQIDRLQKIPAPR